MSTSSSKCPSFDGNPDLYGLGIRIGVYLQWFSSWLSVTIDPKSAGETHSVNSVFVFAIIIAVIQAAAAGSIRPVEAFIMTQICLGYLLTVLSTFGIRLQLLRTKRLAMLVTSWKAFWKRDKSSVTLARLDILEAFRFLRYLENKWGSREGPLYRKLVEAHRKIVRNTRPPDSLPLRSLAFLKHSSLSWTSVVWRSIIASIVAVCNIWLWQRGIRTLEATSDSSASKSCNATIFLLWRQDLNGPVLNFLRVLSISYGIIVCTTCFYVLSAYLRLMCSFAYCITREFIFAFAGQKGIDDVRKLYVPIFLLADKHVGTIWHDLIGLKVIAEFWSTPLDKAPRIADLLKMYAVISSRESPPDPLQQDDTTPAKREKGWPIKAICILWHIYMLIAIVWFILCAELTIHWNQIQGVQTLQSTGQLIPFILGLLCSVQTLLRGVLAVIKETYPDWSQAEVPIGFAPTLEMTATNANIQAHDESDTHGSDSPRPQTAP